MAFQFRLREPPCSVSFLSLVDGEVLFNTSDAHTEDLKKATIRQIGWHPVPLPEEWFLSQAGHESTAKVLRVLQCTVQYLQHELEGSEKKLAKALRSAKSLAEERDGAFEELVELRELVAVQRKRLFLCESDVKQSRKGEDSASQGGGPSAGLPCSLCGNCYPTVHALQSHYSKRHKRTEEYAALAATSASVQHATAAQQRAMQQEIHRFDPESLAADALQPVMAADGGMSASRENLALRSELLDVRLTLAKLVDAQREQQRSLSPPYTVCAALPGATMFQSPTLDAHTFMRTSTPTLDGGAPQRHQPFEREVDIHTEEMKALQESLDAANRRLALLESVVAAQAVTIASRDPQRSDGGEGVLKKESAAVRPPLSLNAGALDDVLADVVISPMTQASPSVRKHPSGTSKSANSSGHGRGAAAEQPMPPPPVHAPLHREQRFPSSTRSDTPPGETASLIIESSASADSSPSRTFAAPHAAQGATRQGEGQALSTELNASVDVPVDRTHDISDSVHSQTTPPISLASSSRMTQPPPQQGDAHRGTTGTAAAEPPQPPRKHGKQRTGGHREDVRERESHPPLPLSNNAQVADAAPSKRSWGSKLVPRKQWLEFLGQSRRKGGKREKEVRDLSHVTAQPSLMGTTSGEVRAEEVVATSSGPAAPTASPSTLPSSTGPTPLEERQHPYEVREERPPPPGSTPEDSDRHSNAHPPAPSPVKSIPALHFVSGDPGLAPPPTSRSWPSAPAHSGAAGLTTSSGSPLPYPGPDSGLPVAPRVVQAATTNHEEEDVVNQDSLRQNSLSGLSLDGDNFASPTDAGYLDSFLYEDLGAPHAPAVNVNHETAETRGSVPSMFEEVASARQTTADSRRAQTSKTETRPPAAQRKGRAAIFGESEGAEGGPNHTGGRDSFYSSSYATTTTSPSSARAKGRQALQQKTMTASAQTTTPREVKSPAPPHSDGLKHATKTEPPSARPSSSAPSPAAASAPAVKNQPMTIRKFAPFAKKKTASGAEPKSTAEAGSPVSPTPPALPPRRDGDEEESSYYSYSYSYYTSDAQESEAASAVDSSDSDDSSQTNRRSSRTPPPLGTYAPARAVTREHASEASQNRSAVVSGVHEAITPGPSEGSEHRSVLATGKQLMRKFFGGRKKKKK